MDILTALDKAFDVADKIQDVTGEESAGGKKITLAEGISLGITAIGMIPVFTKFSELVEDWKSRDLEKKAKWVEAFAERFDLSNDELEEQIEMLVQVALTLEGARRDS